jgi:thiol:disulfide interchange protein DsbD
LVCREVCIQGKAQLALTLPVKSQPPAPSAASKDFFTATRNSLPQPAAKNWKLAVADAKDSFVLTVNMGRQVTQATFFPLAESQIDNAAPQKLSPSPAGFRLILQKSDQLLKPIDRLKGVIVIAGDRSYAIDAPVGKPGAAGSGDGVRIPLAQFSEEVPQK